MNMLTSSVSKSNEYAPFVGELSRYRILADPKIFLSGQSQGVLEHSRLLGQSHGNGTGEEAEAKMLNYCTNFIVNGDGVRPVVFYYRTKQFMSPQYWGKVRGQNLVAGEGLYPCPRPKTATGNDQSSN